MSLQAQVQHGVEVMVVYMRINPKDLGEETFDYRGEGGGKVGP